MKKITFSGAIKEALYEEMKRDKSVYLIGQDVGRHGGWFGVTKGLYEEFGPERIIDTPISELIISGSSVGAALMGMRPVAEIMYADFLTLAADHIVNQAAKERYMFQDKDVSVPLVIRTAFGAGGGGGAHHCQNLEMWFAHIPGLKVVMPSTPYDAKGLLKASIRDENPVIFFEHRYLYDNLEELIPEEEYIIPLGEADIKKNGKDVTIITLGAMLQKVLNVAEELNKEGIEAEIVDLRTLRPLDHRTIIKSVKKTGRVVIITEAWKTCGISSEIAALIADEAFSFLKAPIKRIGSLEMPTPVSPILEKAYLPDENDILMQVRKILN